MKTDELMKRISYSILILVLCLAVIGSTRRVAVRGVSIADTCGQGIYSTTDLCDGSFNFGYILNSDAEGFNWTAAKSFSMWGVSIYIDHSVDGTITCRIDDDTDLSADYLAEGTSATITADGYVDIQWSAGCLSITGSAGYYVGCIANSGTLYITDGTGSCSNRQYAAASGGWNMPNADGTLDVLWRAIEDD